MRSDLLAGKSIVISLSLSVSGMPECAAFLVESHTNVSSPKITDAVAVQALSILCMLHPSRITFEAHSIYANPREEVLLDTISVTFASQAAVTIFYNRVFLVPSSAIHVYTQCGYTRLYMLLTGDLHYVSVLRLSLYHLQARKLTGTLFLMTCAEALAFFALQD